VDSSAATLHGRSPQLQIEAKSLEIIRFRVDDSIRVESSGRTGPPGAQAAFGNPEGLGGEAVAGLIRPGVFEEEHPKTPRV